MVTIKFGEVTLELQKVVSVRVEPRHVVVQLSNKTPYKPWTWLSKPTNVLVDFYDVLVLATDKNGENHTFTITTTDDPAYGQEAFQNVLAQVVSQQGRRL